MTTTIPSNWNLVKTEEITVDNKTIVRTIHKQPKTFCLVITRIAQFIFAFISACFLIPLFSRTIRTYLLICRKTEEKVSDREKPIDTNVAVNPVYSSNKTVIAPLKEIEERGGAQDLKLDPERAEGIGKVASHLSPSAKQLLLSRIDRFRAKENNYTTTPLKSPKVESFRDFSPIGSIFHSPNLSPFSGKTFLGARKNLFSERTGLKGLAQNTSSISDVSFVTRTTKSSEFEVINSAILRCIFEMTKTEIIAALKYASSQGFPNDLFEIQPVKGGRKYLVFLDNERLQIKDLINNEVLSGSPAIFNMFLRRVIGEKIELPPHLACNELIKLFIDARVKDGKTSYTRLALMEDIRASILCLTQTTFQGALPKSEEDPDALLEIDDLLGGVRCRIYYEESAEIKSSKWRKRKAIKALYILPVPGKELPLRKENRDVPIKVGNNLSYAYYTEKEVEIFTRFILDFNKKFSSPQLREVLRSIPSNHRLKAFIGTLQASLDRNAIRTVNTTIVPYPGGTPTRDTNEE